MTVVLLSSVVLAAPAPDLKPEWVVGRWCYVIDNIWILTLRSDGTFIKYAVPLGEYTGFPYNYHGKWILRQRKLILVPDGLDFQIEPFEIGRMQRDRFSCTRHATWPLKAWRIPDDFQIDCNRHTQ